MGIYKRVRHIAVAASCAAGLVAGVGAIAAPGSAFAACSNITGSGSSLQGEQQTQWTVTTPWTGLACSSEPHKVTYTSTSSGAGLEEFGMTTGLLVPAKAGNGKNELDAFIGTDDPPTKAELEKAKSASESTAETFPIVDAPIVVIIHAPISNCTINLTAGTTFAIPNAVLSKLWDGVYASWRAFLLAIPNVAAPGSTECTGEIHLYAREESSGTSFAFKQYLCQTDETTWGAGIGCESGDGDVTDSPIWPNLGAIKRTAKGSGGMVTSVEGDTEGGIGYVNFANAKGKFVNSESSQTSFYATINNEVEPATGAGENTLKCPTEYKGTAPNVAGEFGPEWSAVHLASKAQSEEAKVYPLCTFTYDVFWENYGTTKLTEAYTAAKDAAIANTAREYAAYMVATGAGATTHGQSNLKAGYGALPTAGLIKIQKEAETVTKKVN
jgi:ABC-type phosphate transport system substrate-binding protein